MRGARLAPAGAQAALAAAALLCGWVPRAHGGAPWPAGGAAGAVAGCLLFRALAGSWPRVGRPRRSRAAVLVCALGLLACVSIAEEIVWRGLVLGRLRGPTGSLPALAASTVGFAAGHVRASARRGAGAHLLTGAAFGGLVLLTGGLAGAIAAHVSYNAWIVLALESRPPPVPARS